MDEDLTMSNIVDAVSNLIAHQMKAVRRAEGQKVEDEERGHESEYDYAGKIRDGAVVVAELRRLRIELEDLRTRLIRG
jgi:hypothetical protein